MEGLDDFKRWKVDVLRQFCRCRGLAVGGKRKDELVALAYAANIQKLPIIVENEQESNSSTEDYCSLLTLSNGTEIPDLPN